MYRSNIDDVMARVILCEIVKRSDGQIPTVGYIREGDTSIIRRLDVR